MVEKLGVYVCHCGSNIAGVVDVAEVARWAGATIEGVVVARDYKFMCSSLGQQLIEDDIRKHGLTGVVVAACSPHLHERTFRRACQNAGINPYLFQMVNLREHCSWVCNDKEAAQAKSKALVYAAAQRVKQQRPLEVMHVTVNPATLVVGGGIAGLQATLELADAGYHVYLVDREPSIGGHMAQFDKTFPTLDCSACILTPKMSEAGQHPNVTLLTYSELEEVSGSVGNFKVKVRKKARYVNESLCTGCGICVEKCPQQGRRRRFRGRHGQSQSDLYALPPGRAADSGHRHGRLHLVQPRQVQGLREGLPHQRDRLTTRKTRSSSWRSATSSSRPAGSCSTARRRRNTPTDGCRTCTRTWNSSGCATPPARPTARSCFATARPSRRRSPSSIASAAATSAIMNRARAVCCMAALKFGHLVLEKTKAEVYSFYIDMRTYQKGYEEFYQRLLKEGMHFVRGKVAEVTDAARTPEEKGRLVVQVEDTLLGRQRRIPVDMVVLMGAVEPQADAKELGLKCGISCNMQGWYTERHPKLDPVATMTDGVFVAGRLPGPQGHPRVGGPGRRRRRAHRRHDRQGPRRDRADRGLDLRETAAPAASSATRFARTTPSTSTRRRASAA